MSDSERADEILRAERRVVVGIDGFGNSRAPLDWALNEAVRRSVELEVVHAFGPGYDVSSSGIPGPVIDISRYEAAAKAYVDEVVGTIHAKQRAALPSLQRVVIPSAPGAALVDASERASMLVVGRRGRGAVTGLLGSVSHQCVHHAHCPVTVVPPDWTQMPVRKIVVGIDGSAESERALRWALAEAAQWRAELVVVHAWFTPYPVEPWGVVVTPTDRDRFDVEARELIEASVSAAVRDGAPEPSWAAMAIEDASGSALVQASSDADLLVVGSRGRGGFRALLLGSTSLQCLHHAHCPVTVVRGGE
ncbi:MAG TPA: universal stress protein [Acidimicrobiales bacterium]|nr:universal stress protein [Acidimicrobiales bacterium]